MTPSTALAPNYAANSPEFITPAGTTNLAINMINEIKRVRADFQTRYGIAMGLKETKDFLEGAKSAQKVSFQSRSFTYAQLLDIMKKVVTVENSGYREDTEAVAVALGLPYGTRG